MLKSPMLTNTVAILHDNGGHGEDHYVVRTLNDNMYLDAVMDGVTGRRGWEASQTLADALAVAPLTSPADLVAVLEDVNQQLYRRGLGHFLLTTIAAALYCESVLHIVGAGDSPIVLIRPDAHQLFASRTSGFSPLGPMRAIGISKQLGTLYRAEVTLTPGDRVVLATDGITDLVPQHELVEIVRTAASPEAAVEQLHRLLVTRHAAAPLGSQGRRDDWTTIVRFFSS
jgi:serine/threonine protein phosphatase PrpC